MDSIRIILSILQIKAITTFWGKKKTPYTFKYEIYIETSKRCFYSIKTQGGAAGRDLWINNPKKLRCSFVLQDEIRTTGKRFARGTGLDHDILNGCKIKSNFVTISTNKKSEFHISTHSEKAEKTGCKHRTSVWRS
jgi:hypothetical protein